MLSYTLFHILEENYINMNPKRILIIACCFSLFAACTKSETENNNNNTNNNNTPNPQKILEEGKWQLTAGTATTTYKGKDTTIDIYSEMEECDKDDFILFASNGTGTIDENANKCTDDQQIENFTWALLNNDTKLAVVDSNPDTMDVVELTTSQLKLKLTKPSSSGTPITTIQTYKNIK